MKIDWVLVHGALSENTSLKSQTVELIIENTDYKYKVLQMEEETESMRESLAEVKCQNCHWLPTNQLYILKANRIAQKRTEEKEALQKKLEEFTNQLNELQSTKEKVNQLNAQLSNVSKELDSLSKKYEAQLSASKTLENEKNRLISEVIFSFRQCT